MKILSLNLLLVLLFSVSSCKKEVSEACTVQPDPGPCEAYIPRYYYDTDKEKCTEFIWGGCDGEVPFETMEECKECIGGSIG